MTIGGDVTLYTQIADAMGWSLSDVQSYSLITLRELVYTSVKGLSRQALLLAIDTHLQQGSGTKIGKALDDLRAKVETSMPLPQLVGPTTTLQDLDDYVESFGLHHLSVHWHTGDKKTGGLYEVHGGAGTLPHAGYGNTLADAVTAFFGAVVRARAAAAAEPPRERFADFVSKALEAFPDARVEEGPDGELVVYTNHRETKDGFVVPLKAEGKETP